MIKIVLIFSLISFVIAQSKKFSLQKSFGHWKYYVHEFLNEKDVLECTDDLGNVRYGTCPINLTVTIDFSSAMINPENIEYVISRSNL